MKPFKDTYVMYQLLEFIDESSIIALCKASKKLNEICKQYIEIEDDKRFEVIVNNDKYDNSELLEEYCNYNYIIRIRKLIQIDLYLYYGLYGACKGGYIDIVKFMIKKGANHWDLGLGGACRNGHIDIVKLMIEKGATWCIYCNNGNKSIKEHLSKSE